MIEDIATRLRLRPTILRKNQFGDMETDRAATALFDDCHAIMREAADEIERLRAERDEARRELRIVQAERDELQRELNAARQTIFQMLTKLAACCRAPSSETTLGDGETFIPEAL